MDHIKLTIISLVEENELSRAKSGGEKLYYFLHLSQTHLVVGDEARASSSILAVLG